MATPNSNKEPLGSQGSKKKSDATEVDRSPFILPIRPAAPTSNQTGPLNNNMPNPPRSTVERSRFFPGGRPAPGLVLRGYGTNQGQGEIQATEQTPSSQKALAQGQGQGTAENRSTTNENTPSNFATASTSLNAPQPRRVARLVELEQSAPTTEAQKRLHATRPGDTWVTGLQSWRQQRPPQGFDAKASSSFLRNQQQSSTLSPFAPTFQSYSQRPIAPAPAFAAALAPPPPPPMGAFPGAQGFGNADGQRQPSQGFRPMHNKLDPDAKNRPLTTAEIEYRRAHGISTKYRGETTNPQNISADIPDHENCSLFLTNLPPNCSYRDLLAAVARHQPGRIYSTYISPPDAESDQNLPSHRTSAAKMAFFRPEDATRLLQACSLGLVKVQGYRVHARRNRVKVSPASRDKDHKTRCIVISGPKALVDEMQLRRLFDKFFSYDIEEVILLQEGESLRWMEWRFGSYRAQAESAFKMLTDKDFRNFYSVRYAKDPCDRVFG